MQFFPNFLKRAAAALLCLLLAFSMVPFCPSQAHADASSSLKTVRVGWLANNVGFQEGVPGEYMTGWGYEYLQTLSYYTPGWNYEYVTGSFNELMAKLEAGEIDLMPNISYTSERAEKLLYSANPQGAERYYIYAKSNRDELSKGDPKALNGLTIGANDRGVMQTDVGIKWLEDEGVSCKYKFYSDANKLFAALAADKVDAIIMNDTLSSEDAMPMFYVGESSYYLVTPKARQDLMDDINTAMAQIQSVNPRYNDEVKTSYSVSNGGASTLTNKERSWLASHDNTIVFGYLEDWLPYSGKGSHGDLEGSLASLTSELSNRFGVKVICKPYAAFDALRQALADGGVDVAMPCYKNYFLAERSGFMVSSVLATTSVIMISADGETDPLSVIAYSPHALINKEALELKYPTAKLVSCDSPAACVEAVKSGRATCTLACGTRLDELRSRVDFADLRSAELSESIELVATMRKGEPELLTIVDKGIVNAEVKISDATMIQEASNQRKSDLAVFITEHQAAIVACVVVFLLLVVIALAWALRDARKAKEKAQQANAAKSAFLARMSHDIRTPLNGIVGLIEVDELDPNNTAALKENRAKAKVAADHLLTLINDILEMSKIEDRAIVLESKPFDLRKVVDDVCVLGRLRAAERSVTVISDEGANLEYPCVVGSPVHVRRVLLNIVDNCIKYNKPGGRVTFSTSTVGVEGDTATYRFVIQDTGIGMSEEFLKRIYEPFAQEKDDARSSFQGTGMGMPIVKGLVEEMGGSIEVQSKLGEGSVFVIVLPFAIDRDPGACDGVKEKSRHCSIEGLNLMLVEDNELNTDIAQALLANAGANVTCVANGADAVELFESREAGTFDAILMDIMMPVMDGYEATRAIRLCAKADATSIPIIAMTANAFIEDVRKAHEAGMNDHIAKPIDIEVVKKTVCKHCKR